MTDIGEGTAVTKIKEEKAGDLRVQVRDICDGALIESAEVSIGSNKQVTDNSGEVEFSGLPAGAVGVKAKKHFKEADYSTFLVHYISPISNSRIMRDYEAKSMVSESAIIKAGEKAKIRLNIRVYKLVGEIVFHRRHIDKSPEADDKYGHWWAVFDENMSFGWWPKYPLWHPNNRRSEPPEEPSPLQSGASWRDKTAHMFAVAQYKTLNAMYNMKESSPARTLRGVEGELNGVSSFGGVARPGKYLDPHHKGGDNGDEQYTPIRKDCFDINLIKKNVENFSISYSGGWSWRFEAGNHCHTFQKKIMNKFSLDKVKVIK